VVSLSPKEAKIGLYVLPSKMVCAFFFLYRQLRDFPFKESTVHLFHKVRTSEQKSTTLVYASLRRLPVE
jgi:hypothetical protein